MSEAEETTTRKRKFEDDSLQENGSKRKLVVEEEPEPQTPEQQNWLLDFADEILMEILIKLDGESLHSLST